jgi:alpha-glucosidase
VAPYGFGPAGRPWLPQPAEWADLTVERQRTDPDSMLALYRNALRLRRALPALGDGTMTWLECAPDVLAFTREPGFACVVNFGTEPADPPDSLSRRTVVLASSPVGTDGRVPGSSTVWYSG